MTRDRTALFVTAGVLLLGAALAAGALYRHAQHELRGLASIETASETALTFNVGWLESTPDSWATHTMTISIATDDFAQTLELYDRYVVEGSALRPEPGAAEQQYRLTDATPDVAVEVIVPELQSGTHRATITIPVRVEPAEGLENLYESLDDLVTVTLSYEVFRASPQTLYCSQADRILRGVQSFDPDFFVQAGADTISEEDLARIHKADKEFRSRPGNDRDPGPFFDAIEDVCGIKYRDRWITYVN